MDPMHGNESPRHDGVWSRRCPLCPQHPPFSRFCSDSVQWKLIGSLWLRCEAWACCTHERGEKYLLVVCKSGFLYWIYMQCKHISRHFRGFMCFFEITHLCGVARQPARISCFMPFFLFKRVGKPPLTKLKKNDNTQLKLPSSHCAPQAAMFLVVYRVYNVLGVLIRPSF